MKVEPGVCIIQNSGIQIVSYFDLQGKFFNKILFKCDEFASLLLFKKNCKKTLPKIPNQFIENSQKKIIIKRKIPPKFQKNSQDIENIQLPTSHLEAINPFGRIFFKNQSSLIVPATCLIKKLTKDDSKNILLKL